MKQASYIPTIRTWVILVIASLAVSACGKKLGTASSINFQNWQATKSLATKMQLICQKMQTDASGPNLIGMVVTPNFCQNPGVVAQRFSTMREFNFTAVDSSGEPFVASANNSASGSQLGLVMEAAVYLDLDLISIAGAVLRSLKKGETKTGQHSSFEVLSQDIDDKALKGSLQATLSTRGSPETSILIQHNLVVHFAKIGDSLAFTVETVGNQPKETSLFDSFKVSGVILFHGGNALLQLAFNMNAHSFGVDTTFQREILKTISNIIYEAMDQNLRENPLTVRTL